MKIFWKIVLQILLVFNPIVSLLVFLSNKIIGLIGLFVLFASVVVMYQFGIKTPEAWIFFAVGLVISIIAQNIPLLAVGYEELLGKIEVLAYGMMDDE